MNSHCAAVGAKTAAVWGLVRARQWSSTAPESDAVLLGMNQPNLASK
jgi:hypothetical protein